jgi:hypothetical protein
MRSRSIALIVSVLALATARVASAEAHYVSPPSALAGVTFISQTPAAPQPEPSPARLNLTFEPPAAETAAPQRPVVIEYSDGYRLRAKIHRYASFATLPLFALEGWAGQSLYNNPTSGKKTAHLAIASGIGALFAVNAVTGVWNLVESRKDPNNRTRRTIHGILMLAASAGFVATAATGPENEFENGIGRGEGSPSAHRAIAFTSIGLAAASYLIMLFGR